MKHEKIKSKLENIKQLLSSLHQSSKKVSDATFEHFMLQLSEYEELIGPKMDEAEMFFVEGQLEEMERKLNGYR